MGALPGIYSSEHLITIIFHFSMSNFYLLFVNYVVKNIDDSNFTPIEFNIFVLFNVQSLGIKCKFSNWNNEPSFTAIICVFQQMMNFNFNGTALFVPTPD